jgi:hypothetical protein
MSRIDDETGDILRLREVSGSLELKEKGIFWIRKK